MRRVLRGVPRRIALIVVGLGALSGGCGPGPTQVWGTAICGGKPLTQGIIRFMPLSDTGNVWGMGLLDDRGRFVIEASRDVPFPPGRYGVYVDPPLFLEPGTGRRITPPGYPVPAKYLDLNAPAIVLDVEPRQASLELRFDE